MRPNDELGTMNVFRLAGDFSHLFSFVILLYILFTKKSASGEQSL